MTVNATANNTPKASESDTKVSCWDVVCVCEVEMSVETVAIVLLGKFSESCQLWATGDIVHRSDANFRKPNAFDLG